MDSAQAFALGYLVLGALLVAVSLSHSYIARLPLSAAMLYLLVGLGLGPLGLDLLRLDPLDDSRLLERLTEVAVVVSLFVAGMKLDLPLRDRRWRLPLLLATLSMLVTVAAIAAIGVWLLGLPVGVAVLLGAILAPTDPVLASDVQLTQAGDRDRLRFALTGEGGLNDGTAFPFVMLGLALLELHPRGEVGWLTWATVDLIWASVAGIAIGGLLGAGVGRAVLHLRRHHREAWGSDEFISLGLIALSYGAALLAQGYGFLAVFAAGLALGRIDRAEQEVAHQHHETPAEHAEPANATPMAAVQQFNLQLERVAEVSVVLAIGLLLAHVDFMLQALWFVPLLFLVIRPASVWMLLALLPSGTVRRPQPAFMAWFGIRGIGSIYYLMYAISHGLSVQDATPLVSLTITVVVSSMVAHGVSVTPLMHRYEEGLKRRAARKTERGGKPQNVQLSSNEKKPP